LTFLIALSGAWMKSKGAWRTFYGHLFGASLTYATSSYVANWAISRGAYYSGSLHDIPLAASMAWITLIGVWTRGYEPDSASKKASTAYGVWVPRLGMIAVFTLPLFAAWTLSDAVIPIRIRWFRVELTLGAALVMGIMVFVRQHFLDRELVRLLNYSRDSVENLKHLQAQIVESEKLASIGQLVGGAAHELNNPITAMLGYSDLLVGTALNPDQQALAAKIGQHVRRTKSLVSSLLSFAKQTPAAKTAVNLNTLVRTALRLSQPQLQPLQIGVRAELEAGLPAVAGDSNQLLQVCLQIISDSLQRMDEQTGHTLTVTTQRKGDMVIFQVSEDTHQLRESETGQSSYSDWTENGTGQGLSACHGIVQEHHGRILCKNSKDGSKAVRVELPCNALTTSGTTAPAIPLLAESRPFA
jgi:signal transduction histidine kinase